MAADANGGIVQSISDNLGTVFRHLFPGIIITGGAYVAHPKWFSAIDTRSWQHIFVVAVTALALGNLWFAVNRYVLHQFVDWISYMFGSQGPARSVGRIQYLDDVARHATDSLCLDCIPIRARQHISFRASAILLLYTVAEIGFLGVIWTEPCSVFAHHPYLIASISFVIFVAAIWQNVIVRRIDHCIIEFGRKKGPSTA